MFRVQNLFLQKLAELGIRGPGEDSCMFGDVVRRILHLRRSADLLELGRLDHFERGVLLLHYAEYDRLRRLCSRTEYVRVRYHQEHASGELYNRTFPLSERSYLLIVGNAPESRRK